MCSGFNASPRVYLRRFLIFGSKPRPPLRFGSIRAFLARCYTMLLSVPPSLLGQLILHRGGDRQGLAAARSPRIIRRSCDCLPSPTFAPLPWVTSRDSL